MENSPSRPPFWAMQFLILCLGIWAINSLLELNKEWLYNQNIVHRLLPKGEEALKANKKLTALVRDLNSTAERDAGAAQVLKEFKLSLSNVPNSSNAK